MKTLITGSLSMFDPDPLLTAIRECGWAIDEVVTGPEHGVCEHAARWAAANHKVCHIIASMASVYGMAARRQQLDLMLASAHAVIVVWGGHDRELGRLLSAAKGQGVPVHEVRAV